MCDSITVALLSTTATSLLAAWFSYHRQRRAAARAETRRSATGERVKQEMDKRLRSTTSDKGQVFPEQTPRWSPGLVLALKDHLIATMRINPMATQADIDEQVQRRLMQLDATALATAPDQARLNEELLILWLKDINQHMQHLGSRMLTRWQAAAGACFSFSIVSAAAAILYNLLKLLL